MYATDSHRLRTHPLRVLCRSASACSRTTRSTARLSTARTSAAADWIAPSFHMRQLTETFPQQPRKNRHKTKWKGNREGKGSLFACARSAHTKIMHDASTLIYSVCYEAMHFQMNKNSNNFRAFFLGCLPSFISVPFMYFSVSPSFLSCGFRFSLLVHSPTHPWFWCLSRYIRTLLSFHPPSYPRIHTPTHPPIYRPPTHTHTHPPTHLVPDAGMPFSPPALGP